MKIGATVLGLLLFINYCFSQKEANIWYFGKHAGLDFSNGNPTVLNNGQINTSEGVASICDKNGVLLFYTDGENIWNAAHTIMQNGNGLFGSFTATQSAIIVPFVNDPFRYYVFTVDQIAGPHGLCYSVVNMSLDNGFGAVETKNIPLVTPVCEKVTAVRHCNGKDIWVVTHLWNSNAFYSYLITNTGLTATPVISNSGRTLNGNIQNTVGCLKISPDGSKLAIAHNNLNLDLFDFNNITGVVSNPIPLFLPAEFYSQPYGVEFSSNSQLLYTTVFYYDLVDQKDFNVLLQYDLTQPTAAAIITSKKVIFKYNTTYQQFASLQMGPNGKMYMAQSPNEPYLSVLNFPDKLGAACDFQYSSIQLPATILSTFGLPSFIQSYWLPGFDFTGACNSQLIAFNYNKPQNVTSVKWDFGDPLSGPNNTSVLQNPSHLFSSVGSYNVKLIRYYSCGTDTVTKIVQSGGMQVDLGKDTVLCGVASFNLKPLLQGNNTFLWQDGSTASDFIATQTDLYWVEVTNTLNGCVKRDSVNLTFSNYPNFSLGTDITKCTGEVYTMDATVSGGQYLWSTNSTNPFIGVTQPGIYWVDVNLNGCVKRDSITVNFNPAATVNFGKDTTVCEDQTLLLDATNVGATYQWQDLSANSSYLVNKKGQYFVTINRQGCIAKDTINISYNLKPAFTLGPDQFICSGKEITLDPKISGVNYLWQDGSVNSTYIVSKPGTYHLTVSNTCGILSDIIDITKGVCNLYIPNSFTPNGDGKNDFFKANYGEDITNYLMQVYNRYGQLIFETTDKLKGWDGSYKGKKQPYDAYVWIIQYKGTGIDILQKLQGAVLLIR